MNSFISPDKVLIRVSRTDLRGAHHRFIRGKIDTMVGRIVDFGHDVRTTYKFITKFCSCHSDT